MTPKSATDTFLITSELAAELRQHLAAGAKGRWTNAYCEIQNGGKRVYCSIDLVLDEPQEVIDSYKEEIMQSFGRRLPAQIDGEWSWTVGIRYREKIIDAIDALAFAYEG